MYKGDLTTIPLEAIVENTPQYIFWKDRNSVYLGCNENFAYIAGLKNPKEVVGKTDFDLPWAKNFSHIYLEEDKSVIQTGQSIEEQEVPLVTAQNKNIILLVSKKPLFDKQSNVIGILGIYIDITERKKIEQELSHAKKAAEVANEAKSDFISNMQHDLMTPFAGIHGAADVLYAFYADKYPELKEWLEPMVKSCEQWERIHYSMFDVLKLIDPTLTIEKFYPYDEISNVAEMMSAFLHFKHLQLLIPTQEEIEQLGMLESNRLKVHLILLSLISNAIKFTDTGQIEVKVSSDESHFSIQIEDTGIGIPSDKFEYIFEKFTKLSRSNLYAGSFKGIGAGLYIARHQAHSLGGEIKVASDVGKGSIFTLLLPKSYKF